MFGGIKNVNGPSEGGRCRLVVFSINLTVITLITEPKTNINNFENTMICI